MNTSDDLASLEALSSLKLVYRRELPAPPVKVWDWQRRAHATDRLNPYPRFIEILRRPVHLFTGAVSIIRLRFLFWSTDLRFEHESHEVAKSFCERMVRGPMKRWKHQHLFIPWKDGVTLLEDRIEIIATRYEWLNRWIHPIVEKRLDALFNWRHHVTHYDLRLWNELPFAIPLYVLSANPRQQALTESLQAALEPIPVSENDPNRLTSTHEGCVVVLNALGYRSNEISRATLNNLARMHAHTIICFGHLREPRWLASLSAYGDRIIYIQVGLLLCKWMRFALKMGWKPKSWCCEEDILSCIFQIAHDRLGSARYSLGCYHQINKAPGWRDTILTRVRNWLDITPLPAPYPPFPLRERAFKTIQQWLAVYRYL